MAFPAHVASSFPPASAPPSPPPPPSPASLASPSLLSTPFHPPVRPIHLLRRATTFGPGLQPAHAVFDLESSSPLSPSGAEKTLLLARLERARTTQVLLRSGQPARPLTERELRRLRREEAGESSTASATTGEGGTTGTEDVEDVDMSTPPQLSVAAVEVMRHALNPRPTQPEPTATAQSAPAASPPSTRDSTRPLAHPLRTKTLVARTAPSTPERSPLTAHFPTLLSRAPQSSTHLDPAQAQATAVSAPMMRSVAGGNALALKLAEAAAAQQQQQQHLHSRGPRKSASPSSPATRPETPMPTPTPKSMAKQQQQQLGKTRSLPPDPSAPPTPRSGLPSHSRATTAPAPASPIFPPYTSLHSRSRTASARLSPSPGAVSPSTSPLLLPVMGSSDPSALTLHFARKPDMPRKGSLGESWSRMCLRGERSTAMGMFGSWSGAGSAGMVRAASEGDTEGESADGESGAEGDREDDEREVLVDASEFSIFASPRSSFASSYLSTTLSRSRSLSSTHTPSASLTTSPSSSPKLVPAKLGGSAGPHAPLGRWEDVLAATEPPAPPPVSAPAFARKPAPEGGKSAALPIGVGAGAPAAGPGQAKRGAVEIKKLRAEQMARRAQALAHGSEWESSSSGDGEDAAEGVPVVEGRGRARGKGRAKTHALRRG